MYLSLSKALIALVLVLFTCAAPVVAADNSCAHLCGSWTLHRSASTDVTQSIEFAISTYKEERERKTRGLDSNDIAVRARAEVEESLGPLRQRPQRDELRAQLQALIQIPAALKLSLDDDVLVVDEGRLSPRRLEPGRPYSRVDSVGTARITIRMKGPVFEVVEDYGKGRSNRESYSVDTKSNQLVVTRHVARPGMKDIKIISVYSPAAAG